MCLLHVRHIDVRGLELPAECSTVSLCARPPCLTDNREVASVTCDSSLLGLSPAVSVNSLFIHMLEACQHVTQRTCRRGVACGAQRVKWSWHVAEWPRPAAVCYEWAESNTKRSIIIAY